MRTNYTEKIIEGLKKWGSFLFENNCLGFYEKLKIISALNRDTAMRNVILKRLVESNDGLSFFSIDGFRIYFQPDYEIVDKKYFLKGITSLLIETFFLPDYFNSTVYLKEGDTVLDIGANIGTTTLLFSGIVGEKGRIFSFEPVTHNVLHSNIEKNNIRNVKVIPNGVSDKVGRGEIEMSDYCLDSSITKRKYTKDYYVNKRTIDLISLDMFAKEMNLDKVDFVKMDIEGAEELAIRGAEKLIDRYHPKWSISSYHIDFDNEPQHDKLVKLLKERGYKIEEKQKCHIYAW